MPDLSAAYRRCLEYMDKIPLIPLEPGQVGVVMARAGAGKTACLTQLAIRHLVRDEPVLHVCVDHVPDKAKVWYRELLKSVLAGDADCDISGLEHRIEPLRFIMSFMNQTFTPAKLEQSIENLREQTKFNPSLLVVDGLDFDRNTRPVFEQIRDIAGRHSIGVWISARMHRHISEVNERGIPYPAHRLDDLFDSIFVLEPQGESIRLKILKQNDNYNPVDSELLLDPQTFLLLKRSA
jgi:hypothetical protein